MAVGHCGARRDGGGSGLFGCVRVEGHEGQHISTAGQWGNDQGYTPGQTKAERCTSIMPEPSAVQCVRPEGHEGLHAKNGATWPALVVAEPKASPAPVGSLVEGTTTLHAAPAGEYPHNPLFCHVCKGELPTVPFEGVPEGAVTSALSDGHVMKGYSEDPDECARVLEAVRAVQQMHPLELAKLMRLLVIPAAEYGSRVYIIGQNMVLAPWLNEELLKRNSERPSEFADRVADDLAQVKAFLVDLETREHMPMAYQADISQFRGEVLNDWS